MKKMSSLLLLVIFLCACAKPNTAVQNTEPENIQTEQTQAILADATMTEPTKFYNPLEELLDSMSLEERVGQLFLAACPGSDILSAIDTYNFGGFILFDKDIKGQTPQSLAETIATYQSASKIPMLIAVDEEGGTVCRISNYAAFRDHPFSSPKALFLMGGQEKLLETEREKCRLLRSVGINVNMAPVCDIATDPQAFMYDRSLSLSPEMVSQVIHATVSLMNSYQIGSVLKHFPGYGNNMDTHVTTAVDDRPLEAFAAADLMPFRAGIDAECGAVLVSHNIVMAFDDQRPASISAEVISYLRDEMCFQGVVMTDDLTMAAITDYCEPGEAAVLAILAGNDMLCTWDYSRQYAAVLEAVENGRISMEQLNASVARILRWKQCLGLLDNLLVS